LNKWYSPQKESIEEENTMLYSSTIITYPLIIILSTLGKKSFENLGRLINRSGDTIYRMLQPKELSLQLSRNIATLLFSESKKLYVGIDDTLLKKIHSRFMVGSGMFFDTKIGRRIMAFRLVIGVVTDGRFTVPIDCAYLFAKELLEQGNKVLSKDEIAQNILKSARKIFPDKELIAVADGLYSSVKFVRWCYENNFKLEARMHSNRVVLFQGKEVKIKDFLTMKKIRLSERQMARTISVIWHEIPLQLTIVRRIDRNDNESFVFQIATYKSLPREHVANYKKRWPIEMLIRTTKQHLGLQECFSQVLETQENHVASVFLAYALAQFEMKKSGLDTPEQAIRRCKTKNLSFLAARFHQFLGHNLIVHA
jgi:hypothetical protein